MLPSPGSDFDLAAGLNALVESSFPKRCNCCGRIYADAATFLRETHRIRPEHSGMRQSIGDFGEQIVEAFRNCECGSTLMDVFNDRRDLSPNGIVRRGIFNDLLAYLQTRGLTEQDAQTELKRVLKGGHSELLSRLPV
ncbi:MAG: hypothetical protein JO142_19480 [Burkholderiales bacterium]|nr:hypothetical protein [Burkholderiales bacterium]